MHPSMMRRAVRPLSHLLPKRLPQQQQQQQASRALSVQAVVDDVAVEVTHTSSASAAPQQQQQQPQQPPRSGAGGFQGETRVLGGAKAVLRNVRACVEVEMDWIGLPCMTWWLIDGSAWSGMI